MVSKEFSSIREDKLVIVFNTIEVIAILFPGMTIMTK